MKNIYLIKNILHYCQMIKNYGVRFNLHISYLVNNK
jgi:hypothetical protein